MEWVMGDALLPQTNPSTPLWKKKIYNPFLELDESWVRPQANLNIPIWKTNFYTSFWNWRISIPLYEKQISILLLELTLFCGWERKTIRLTTSNEFQYSFMESKFLYSFLELDESWVRPQTNFNTPLWKTNFYSPLRIDAFSWVRKKNNLVKLTTYAEKIIIGKSKITSDM